MRSNNHNHTLVTPNPIPIRPPILITPLDIISLLRQRLLLNHRNHSSSSKLR